MEKITSAIAQEAAQLPSQQLREVIAMAKGMEAANKIIAQERGA